MEKMHNPGYIIMEDLSQAGGVVNKVDGVNKEKLYTFTDALAKMYARSLRPDVNQVCE